MHQITSETVSPLRGAKLNILFEALIWGGGQSGNALHCLPIGPVRSPFTKACIS